MGTVTFVGSSELTMGFGLKFLSIVVVSLEGKQNGVFLREKQRSQETHRWLTAPCPLRSVDWKDEGC